MKDDTNPQNYCIDCTVYICKKTTDGYYFLGHSESIGWKKCQRKRRKHKWNKKELKELNN